MSEKIPQFEFLDPYSFNHYVVGKNDMSGVSVGDLVFDGGKPPPAILSHHFPVVVQKPTKDSSTLYVVLTRDGIPIDQDAHYGSGSLVWIYPHTLIADPSVKQAIAARRIR